MLRYYNMRSKAVADLRGEERNLYNDAARRAVESESITYRKEC